MSKLLIKHFGKSKYVFVKIMSFCDQSGVSPVEGQNKVELK